MKITKTRLTQIIREELEATLSDSDMRGGREWVASPLPTDPTTTPDELANALLADPGFLELDPHAREAAVQDAVSNISIPGDLMHDFENAVWNAIEQSIPGDGIAQV
jgi:hypothetical protein